MGDLFVGTQSCYRSSSFFYRQDVRLFIKEFILFSPETGCVSKVTNDGVVDAGLTSVMVLIVRTIK